MNSFVSIIVPCYNQAQFLDECLQSVLEQTYENWECIIVNDGSPDDTEVVAKKWLEKDNRFEYLYKKNGGLSSARNAGIKIAKGEFIQLLDSDDLLQKNKLQIQIDAFLKDTEIDISISGYRYFEDGHSELRILGRDNFLPEVAIMKNDSDIIKLFNVKNPMVISAPLYKKSIFKTVGLFDEDLSSLEDWDFHTRCALHNLKFQHVGYFPNSFTLIRLHGDSMMRNVEKMEKAYLDFKEKRLKNQMYVEYFPIQSIKKKPIKKVIKSKIKLFIPPIVFVVVRKFKKMINGY
jgi:glycosyltransferase involved in cell wall biosynthesis